MPSGDAIGLSESVGFVDLLFLKYSSDRKREKSRFHHLIKMSKLVR